MKFKDKDMLKLERAFFLNLKYDNCEYGGIGIDPKRPFGNSDVESDILKIIGAKMEGNDGGDKCWSSDQIKYAAEMYDSLIWWLQRKYSNGKRMSYGEWKNGKWATGIVNSKKGREGNK